MGFKKNDEWNVEDRDQMIFNLRQFIWGMANPNDDVKAGFGICNHCMFADIEGEQIDHPEGLGKVVVGANIECKIKQPFPKGFRLSGSSFKATERCPSYVPKICELCGILDFNRLIDCANCPWEED